MVADSIDDCIPAWPCDMTALKDAVTLYLFHYVPVTLRTQVWSGTVSASPCFSDIKHSGIQ